MNLTKQQTHIRAFKTDKARLAKFMRKYKIKSQAQALRIIFGRARL